MNIANKIIQQLALDYDTISSHFDETRQYNWDEVKTLVNQYVKPNQNILDLGCGNGRLIDILPDNISYTGLDISNNLIKKAKKKYPQYTFVHGDMTNANIEDNQFDIVIAIASFHHIPIPKLRKQTLANIHIALKDNGLLIMTNWNLFQEKYLPFHNTDFKYDRNLEENDTFIPWKNSEGNTMASRYYHAFTLKELSDLLTDFDIIENKIQKHNIITVAQKLSI